MTLRERFERAFGTTSARSTARWNTGTYRDAAVELAWQMWQKGWRWSANSCMEACEAEATVEGQRCADACRVVREALYGRRCDRDGETVSERIGIAVYCTTCRRRKTPVGRDAPPSIDLCNAFECDGYYQEPHPGQLWPGERESEFGYPCGTHGTIVSDDYPAWICADCGSRLGRLPADHISTWHRDTCGWCGEVRDVTEPRDYGWPARE